MSRITPGFALLFGSVLVLSACSTGPQQADLDLSRPYDCMNAYSECDKPTHLESFSGHDHDGNHDHGDPSYSPGYDHGGDHDHGGGQGHGGGHGR
jgi:hypothetical protein